jgi:hypothetical protein
MLAATRTARASAKLLRPRTRNFCKELAKTPSAREAFTQRADTGGTAAAKTPAEQLNALRLQEATLKHELAARSADPWSDRSVDVVEMELLGIVEKKRNVKRMLLAWRHGRMAQPEHTFSETLHTTWDGSKLSDPRTLSGFTGCDPYLSDAACPPGEEMICRMLVEGDNNVFLGAMRNVEGMDLNEQMHYNEDVWCVFLGTRSTYLAGRGVSDGRTAGPEQFPVPVTLDVTINASDGTIAVAIVDGEDLGVVITSMETEAPLHLAVGTHDSRCKVTLLDRGKGSNEMQTSSQYCYVSGHRQYILNIVV